MGERSRWHDAMTDSDEAAAPPPATGNAREPDEAPLAPGSEATRGSEPDAESPGREAADNGMDAEPGEVGTARLPGPGIPERDHLAVAPATPATSLPAERAPRPDPGSPLPASDDLGSGVDGAHDELEHGIASVIASLYADIRDTGAAAGAGPGAAEMESPTADDDFYDAIGAHADDDMSDGSDATSDDDFDESVTYRLLGELDRLWHHRAA